MTDPTRVPTDLTYDEVLSWYDRPILWFGKDGDGGDYLGIALADPEAGWVWVSPERRAALNAGTFSVRRAFVEPEAAVYVEDEITNEVRQVDAAETVDWVGSDDWFVRAGEAS